MSLDSFDRLIEEADTEQPRVPLTVAGGNDATVLEALRAAADRGWVVPTLVGPVEETRALAGSLGVGLNGLSLLDAEGEGEAIAAKAVAEVRAGRSKLLMKGRIATPGLLHAVLDPATGLRTGTSRVVCQVVLMDLPRDGRRFLLADTGISIRPRLEQKADILGSAVAVAQVLARRDPAWRSWRRPNRST